MCIRARAKTDFYRGLAGLARDFTAAEAELFAAA